MTTTKTTCDECKAPEAYEYHLNIEDPDAVRDGGMSRYSINQMLCDQCAASALLDDLVISMRPA